MICCCSDLWATVEELRKDVLERGCRVNKQEVKTMALTLDTVTKEIAQLKGWLPERVLLLTVPRHRCCYNVLVH